MAAGRVAIRDDLLSAPLDDLSAVRLIGSRCRKCGEVSLGRSAVCPNCGGDELETGPMSDAGVLWTYTVVRNKPPGAYRGPEPFKPFCVGLVELPDGLRVNSVVDVDPDEIEIGMKLRFKAFVHHTDESGHGVVGFAFAAEGSAHDAAGRP